MQTTIGSKSSVFSRWQTKQNATTQSKKSLLNEIGNNGKGIDVSNALLFFNLLQDFMVEKDYSARAATNGLKENERGIFQAIKNLANNRGFVDAAVTKSLALAIVANIAALDQALLGTHGSIFSSTDGRINREKLSVYLLLMFNFDPINIECIMHYTHDMSFNNSTGELSYSAKNIFGFSVDDDYKLKIAKENTISQDVAKNLKIYVYNSSNTIALMNANPKIKNALGIILQRINEKAAMVFNNHSAVGSSTSAVGESDWMDKLNGVHETQHRGSKISAKDMYNATKSKTKDVGTGSVSYQTPSSMVSFFRSIPSLPSVFNKLSKKEREKSIKNDGASIKMMPINAWEIKYKLDSGDEYFTHCVGAFGVNSQEPPEESLERAYNYLKKIIENDDQNATSWIIDSRLLDGIYKGEPGMFKRHLLALTGAVEKINNERGYEGGVRLICTHIPTTISGYKNLNPLHPLNHASNTAFNEKRTSDIEEFKNFLHDNIQAPCEGANQKVLLNLHCAIDKLCQLLNKPEINAADGLLYDTLLTILVRYIPRNLHNILACRSGKDRTTAEKVALNALKPVIEGKIEQLTEKDFREFLNRLVTANKLNIEVLDTKDRAIFISNYDDKALYFANDENTGVKTNVNVFEMRYVLRDFLYVPKIRECYSRVHPGA